jgi:hypothetical protein
LKLPNLYIVYYLVNVHAIVCHSIQCWHLFFLFCFYTIQFDWITKKEKIRQDNVLPRLSLLLISIDEIKVLSHQTVLIGRHSKKQMDKKYKHTTTKTTQEWAKRTQLTPVSKLESYWWMRNTNTYNGIHHVTLLKIRWYVMK